MTEKITGPARQYRAGVLEVSAPPTTDDSDRRVTLSFSSEEPVSRSFILEDGTEFVGLEILGHSDGEVDLTRLASGRAALLTDHHQTIDSQVGVVEKAWIEGGRGKSIVRFGKGSRATEILERVRDGEVTGVSVGYEIQSIALTGEELDGVPMVRVNWSPYEITLCPVPADPTVGVGRSADGGTTAPLKITRSKELPPMVDKTNTPAAVVAATADAARSVPAAPAPVFDSAAAMREERARQSQIRGLGDKFDVSQDKINAALDGETTVDQFQRTILDGMESKTSEVTRGKDAAIGLTTVEVGNYSLMRAVQFLANPTDNRAREAAKFEIEVSEAAESTLGRTARGLIVPGDILSNQNFVRAQNVGTPSQGGALVAEDHLDGSFIGLLRKRAALTRLGVRTLTNLTGNVGIPRQTGGGTAYWVGEGSGPSESELAVDSVQLTPHTLAAAVAITRRAILQSSPSMEALVRDDLINVLALEMDRVGINGDADADAPDGLLEAPINDVDSAAAGAPTWAEVVEMESEVAADDADVDGMRYAFNAAMRGHLKSTPKVAGTAEFMMNGQEVNGYGAVTSNNTPAAGMLYGNWSDFIIGMWSGLDLTVDTATLAASGGVHLRAFQDLDFAVRHPESFAYGRDYS